MNTTLPLWPHTEAVAAANAAYDEALQRGECEAAAYFNTYQRLTRGAQADHWPPCLRPRHAWEGDNYVQRWIASGQEGEPEDYMTLEEREAEGRD